MDNSSIKKSVTILIHAFVGWALCGLTMGIGMGVTAPANAVVIHAILAPVFFILVSSIYFKKFSYTAPLQTAIIFVSFVIFMDVFVVALLILKSFEMFTSVLGTWVPFLLIFVSTYLTGLYSKRSP